MKPTVRVIAYTKFLGVPSELLPSLSADAPPPTRREMISNAGQDTGSDLARLTECAGRTCYDSYGKGRSSGEFHKHILEVGHGSVLEHASISFYIAGISRGCSHELVRHRAGCAISQRSTRYVDESESRLCWHPLIRKFAEEEKYLRFKDEQLADVLTSLSRLEGQCGVLYRVVAASLENWLIEKFKTDKQTARKQARGAARGVLGNALETALVWTANIRALRNVIEQRASEFADAEIRLLANALLDEAVKVCPEYFSDYERVPCPDGMGFGVKTQFRKV